jgi:glutathione synthase/RimK-type ligase-like ATP-grasp enzyme
MAFTNMGCHVEALCPHEHPVTRTKVIRRIHRHSVLRPLLALETALASSKPDFVIPCDDHAVAHLHALYMRSQAQDDSSSHAVCALIEKSLGKPQAYAVAAARGELMALAAAEGIRTPPTTIATQLHELNAWLVQHPLPVVIKNDFTWGGQGVSIVQRRTEAEHSFHLMTTRPPLLSSMRRWLLDRDFSYLMNRLAPAPQSVTLQDFIAGTPANRAVACWQGQVLAGISVEAIQTMHATGPATVVRVIENAEMTAAAIQLVRKLGISGLWGIDFVLEQSSGQAYLIEMNPRATPICHLPLGPDRDLAAALYEKLAGSQPAAPLAILDHEMISLFPGEWHRNPVSPYLDSTHHDVPWDEPDLVQDGLARPWSERGWIARLWAALRPAPAPMTDSALRSSGGAPHDRNVCATEQTLRS